MTQLPLFHQSAAVPLMVADGVGVDSTALLIGLAARGIRPDAILFANTGSEKPVTMDYLRDVRIPWLKSAGFPPLTIVTYRPQDFKHWPPYSSLEENCLTNSTLPSLAFGFKSCSQKWKIAPQDKWTGAWDPAIEAWGHGLKVRKMIGYDAGPADMRRQNHAGAFNDPLFSYEYPLIADGWSRERCIEIIRSAGIPVPEKSACYFCPSTKPGELDIMDPDLLRRIVMIEARSHPHLMGNWSEERMAAFNLARWQTWKGANIFRPAIELWMSGKFTKLPAPGEPTWRSDWKPKYPKPGIISKSVTGLWRSTTKKRSGKMTDYIRDKRLLDPDEVDSIAATTPTESIHAHQIPDWQSFITKTCNGCTACAAA